MQELLVWMNHERAGNRWHPLLLIGGFIVSFLAIHPFQDGNGRLSRALTTLLMLQAGHAWVPYSGMESVIEQKEDAYYLALRRTQGTLRDPMPDWSPWMMFFLESIGIQIDRLKTKLDRERITAERMPELQTRIIDFAREHGRVSIGKLIRLTGVSRNTLKNHFRALVQRNVLEAHGGGCSVWYTLR